MHHYGMTRFTPGERSPEIDEIRKEDARSEGLIWLSKDMLKRSYKTNNLKRSILFQKRRVLQ